MVPPSSYSNGGFATLADCLLDVARALGGDFKRIYVRLDGYCVGERDVVELRREPQEVAAALKVTCDAVASAILPGAAAPETNGP
ncbi:hypothetical protein [Variovorax paradoxus]|uniref:hypothetical protein n=1 Tax=Variovorax paradoxus TaxID=34073 RepID=UPI0003FEF5CE|nr:hypothetical protein [Variovorax paradoxus]